MEIENSVGHLLTMSKFINTEIPFVFPAMSVWCVCLCVGVE